ncbi:hypothetical protein LIN78_11995 [Leeia sp. TBRC 13508]|uniref:DnaT DNA-binding domain-containing protein n=1 Tax=Leeia speluncae TaxID=2884804 RepID=A0ABS8D7W9_9NEIS|nr:DnaT-like ssDNA-binding domain-containing protein [Leeia speluncae]MCB6184266.1 hypothetical protein [Leeia speluncae]
MPTRLIREGILTSDRVDQLTEAGENFYRRLMSIVDDHGLADARTSVLRAKLYPLRLDQVSEVDIASRLSECVEAGLVIVYAVKGKPYLQMVDTRWAARSSPKYPLPDEADEIDLSAFAGHVATECAVDESMTDEVKAPVQVGLLEELEEHAMWVPPPASQAFAMQAAWLPTAGMDIHCRTAGVARLGSELFNEVLAEFRMYWLDRPDKRRQSEWERALLGSLSRRKSLLAGSRQPDRVDKPFGGRKRASVVDSRDYGQVGVGVL